jgi:hypothetical protein
MIEPHFDGKLYNLSHKYLKRIANFKEQTLKVYFGTTLNIVS